MGVQKTSFAISRDLWRRAKIHTLDAGIELQELIALALEEYLRKHKEPDHGTR